MTHFFRYSLFAFILILTACSESGSDNKAKESMQSESTALPEERLYFDIDTTGFAEVSAGDTLTANLMQGESYDLVVFRAEETMPGLYAIAANVDGNMEVGQAALIYRNNELRGTVDMHRMGLKYQVYFDKELGQHYLLPRTDEDELEGSEPLTAPADKLEQE